MKFLTSEGRVICLLEKADVLNAPPARVPQIDLLCIPEHHKQDIENSHLWSVVLQSVKLGLRNVIYF